MLLNELSFNMCHAKKYYACPILLDNLWRQLCLQMQKRYICHVTVSIVLTISNVKWPLVNYIKYCCKMVIIYTKLVQNNSFKLGFEAKFLDAGIQDVSKSISIVHDEWNSLYKEISKIWGNVRGWWWWLVMKVTNIYKHEIVDANSQFLV